MECSGRNVTKTRNDTNSWHAGRSTQQRHSIVGPGIRPPDGGCADQTARLSRGAALLQQGASPTVRYFTRAQCVTTVRCGTAAIDRTARRYRRPPAARRHTASPQTGRSLDRSRSKTREPSQLAIRVAFTAGLSFRRELMPVDAVGNFTSPGGLGAGLAERCALKPHPTRRQGRAGQTRCCSVWAAQFAPSGLGRSVSFDGRRPASFRHGPDRVSAW
jgi:hypothetical protein